MNLAFYFMTFGLGALIGKELAMRHFKIRYSEKKPVIEEEKVVVHPPSGWGEGPVVKIKSDPVSNRPFKRIVRGEGESELEAELRQMKKHD